jgi:hypothetical protein
VGTGTWLVDQPEKISIYTKVLSSMRSREEIEKEIAELENNLARIETAIGQQMAKRFFERRSRTCLFLSIEKKTYLKALQKLKWVLYE